MVERVSDGSRAVSPRPPIAAPPPNICSFICLFSQLITVCAVMCVCVCVCMFVVLGK